MKGDLKSVQIEEMLMHSIIGRLACCEKNVPYIIPISYAYDGKDIYCHTQPGRKIDILRNNNEACFQVDRMDSMAEWKSVIVWGKYEEITEPAERQRALQLLLQRTLPVISSVTTHLGEHWPFTSGDLNKAIPGVVFRIRVIEKTGRYENGLVEENHYGNP